MKILCDTQVVSRQSLSNKRRTAKATLAVGYRPKPLTDPSEKELEILHFTAQNRTGVRYKVKNNIEKMFTKFLRDGKATISFKEPPDNLMIKCDPIQLKGFLQTLKLGMEGNSSIHLRLNIAAATAIPQKSHPVNEMRIVKKSDYPIKGFPNTLKSLVVNNIGLCKVTFQICSLRNLTSLDMSDNDINTIPLEMGRLPLVKLILPNNSLGDSKSWQWLKGLILRNTLLELDLSANKLRFFPIPLLKVTNVVTLKLDNNSIQQIPFGIRRMKKLRYLHLSTNKLESLPSSFNEISLDLLDVWGNNFKPQSINCIERQDLIARNPNPLWLLAARTVTKAKLPFSSATLPSILVDLLLETPRCFCGKLCYSSTVWVRATMATLPYITQMVFSRDRLIYSDIVLCSKACAASKLLLADS